MPTPGFKSVIAAFLGVLLPGLAAAETIEVPVTIDTPFITSLLEDHLLPGPARPVSVWGDDSGCNDLSISRPVAAVSGTEFRVITDYTAQIGPVIGGHCIGMLGSSGKIGTLQQPGIDESGERISFHTVDSELLDDAGDPAGVRGKVWNLTKAYIHPRLDALQIDLGPAMRELRELLPMFFGRDRAGRIHRAMTTLQLSRVETTEGGIRATLSFELETDAATDTGHTVSEAALNAEEMDAFMNRWESWDAFLTYVVVAAAGNTITVQQRDDLLGALLDARHNMAAVLSGDDGDHADALTESFIYTWQQVSPVFRSLSSRARGSEAVRLLGFIVAADAIEAINSLGPVTGWDISVDGLRRLARMLSIDGQPVPLERKMEIDPELRRLFDFSTIVPEAVNGEGASIERLLRHWLFPQAWASFQKLGRFLDLNRAIVDRQYLEPYLEQVGELLFAAAAGVIAENSLEKRHQALFNSLVLATAWQESCWRQFRQVEGRVVPMKSGAGALGMMQIMPLVWRGFYDSNLLAKDITYNAAAGTEILHRYLVRYAIRKGEDRQPGGHDNLARASYAAYNGGPSQIGRYRKSATRKSLKRIDAAFWEKYVQVRAGNLSAVAECY